MPETTTPEIISFQSDMTLRWPSHAISFSGFGYRDIFSGPDVVQCHDLSIWPPTQILRNLSLRTEAPFPAGMPQDQSARSDEGCGGGRFSIRDSSGDATGSSHLIGT
jgi:hypothetical protein